MALKLSSDTKMARQSLVRVCLILI